MSQDALGQGTDCQVRGRGFVDNDNPFAAQLLLEAQQKRPLSRAWYNKVYLARCVQGKDTWRHFRMKAKHRERSREKNKISAISLEIERRKREEKEAIATMEKEQQDNNEKRAKPSGMESQ